MAKGICAVKIFLLREQFRLTAVDAQGIRRFALFVVRTYAAAWFRTLLAAAAPALDLAFVNALCTYPDKELSKVTVPVFCRHLWYLSERLVALALFDPDLSLGVKRDMVQAIYICRRRRRRTRTRPASHQWTSRTLISRTRR